MFGVYRFILALLVASGHYLQLQGDPDLVLYSIGGKSAAVFGFYVLSGFLMTKVLHLKYGYDQPGIRLFLTNRLLRIFPTYWAGLALAVFVVALYGDAGILAQYDLKWPTGIQEWIRNIVIVWPIRPDEQSVRLLIPPSWSLKIELIFYLSMALGASRSKRLTIIWVMMSFTVLSYLLLTGASFNDRYFTVWAATLPFSLGALLYYFPRPHRRFYEIAVLIAMLLFLMEIGSGRFFGDAFRETWGFYFALSMNVALVSMLAGMETGRLGSVGRYLAKWDRPLGELSYPIFIFHWYGSVIVSHLFVSDRLPLSLSLITMSFIVTGVLSYLEVRSVERTLLPLRGVVGRLTGAKP
jgi:peptidoglycan/LPS O-acetylase OafA/YrhL